MRRPLLRRRVGWVQLDGNAAAPGGKADGADMGGAGRVEGGVGDGVCRRTKCGRRWRQVPMLTL